MLTKMFFGCSIPTRARSLSYTLTYLLLHYLLSLSLSYTLLSLSYPLFSYTLISAGMKKRYFSHRIFWTWMLYAVGGGALIYYVPTWGMDGAIDVARGGSAGRLLVLHIFHALSFLTPCVCVCVL